MIAKDRELPTRLIREGILTSERVNELDPPAEVFYRRLLSKVDDHGLYDARPSILRTSLYALRVDRVREADCSRWMAACQKAGLIVLYEADCKPYLRVLDTRWKVRSEPKFPLPPDVTCKQVQTSENNRTVVVVGDVVVVEDEGEALASSAEALSAATPLNGHANGEEKGVIGIPIVGGVEFQVTEAMVAEFSELYPAVDVPATLREIKGWNFSHPAQRKTKRGILAHINTWLGKEQNKG